MSQPTYGIAITADDKTAKGVASAERRLGKLSGRAGRVNERAMGASEKSIGRSGRAIVRTFADAEKAGAKIFGGRSIMAGVSARMGAVGEAASAMGTGMGEAAAEGGILTGIIGGVGAAVAGIVGVVAAAGIALIKLGDGWSRSSASIGRTAEIIGVGTKAMQEFSFAAERMGVDKDKATGSLGGLSQTLNDARYGRNSGAMALLARMGVQLKTKADGTVDVEAMLPAIADALQRQNSSGRRTAARLLGISLDTLPAFTQGGKALSADMADSDATAAVLTDGQIGKAKRQARKSVMRDQLIDLGKNKGLEKAGDAAEYANGGMVSVGRSIAGADTIDRAGGKMDSAAGKIERAADRFASTAGGGGGLRNGALSLSEKDIIDLKKTVATEWVRSAGDAQGEGIVDTILNRLASGRWGNTIASVVNSRKQFSDVNGPNAWRSGRHSVDDIPMSRVSAQVDRLVDQWLAARSNGAKSIIGDNLNYANPDYSDRRNRAWIDRLDGPSLGRGSATHRHGTTPDLQRYRPGDFKVEIPTIKLELDMRGAPAGTRAKATAGGAGGPAVSITNAGR